MQVRVNNQGCLRRVSSNYDFPLYCPYDKFKYCNHECALFQEEAEFVHLNCGNNAAYEKVVEGKVEYLKNNT